MPVERGGHNGADRLTSPEIGAVKRTAAILHIPDLSSLRGEQNLPAAPADVSYGLIGRVLRGEVPKGPVVNLNLNHHNRGLTEDVLGSEVYPKGFAAGDSIEVSRRILRKTGEPRDNVPTYHVNPKPYSLQDHFEVIHVPEGGGEATLTIPKNVERLFDGQYITDPDVSEFDLEPGSFVVLPAVPYALEPRGDKFGYLYASSEPHLQFPGHVYPAVFPVEIVGTGTAYTHDTLYIKGQDHKGLVGSRKNGLSGPETVLHRNMYPSLRELSAIDVVDLRDVKAEEVPVFVAPQHESLVGAH
ncbi:MAG TPA: hypothetical protein VNA13_01925 [Xanthomonadales bacterium]|nr:hypothetical protein [Xanthomonadales bacterium]